MTTTFNAAATKTVRVNGTNFVYREIGNKSGFPVVFLHHLTAVLEDWDPAIADGLAKSRPVIVFDNRGVGGSEGKTPDTVADMAKDAMAFIDALVSVRKHVESCESFVIQERWPDSRRVTDVDGEEPRALRPQQIAIPQ